MIPPVSAFISLCLLTCFVTSFHVLLYIRYDFGHLESIPDLSIYFSGLLCGAQKGEDVSRTGFLLYGSIMLRY